MGAKDSKRSCLSYEDAVKRMTDAEFKRVCEAFKRLTNGGQFLSRHAFTQNVLGDGVPLTIADWLYTACGGSSRGIALRDLICGLVLLTKGTQEEKIKFLWTLYCNDSGTHITRNEFQSALQIEGTLPPPDGTNKPNLLWDRTLISLFGVGQDKVTFEDFRAWIIYNKEATILSKWLLSNPCVSLSSELETPTFYQTLAGVTHLEEQDICELEKCFWALQGASVSGHLDFNCLKSLVCPPVPLTACKGLFLALDVNSDDHVDFKELCCGISAACRGPLVERMKFCFKIFDMDRDCYLNTEEVQHMLQTLLFIANENTLTYSVQSFHENPAHQKRDLFIENVKDDFQKSSLESDIARKHSKTLESVNDRLDQQGGLTQEDFLVWSVENNSLVAPLLELLFQVCHVSLGLKPHCRHDEYEIVMGWLEREERRGYHVGQFWYLVSSDWWQQWLNYTSAPRSNLDFCNCRNEPRMPIEEGIVCDESLISNTTDYTSTSNEFNSNSMESMGDVLSRGDSCSIASSSGVSSSSGTGPKRSLGQPGPIENSNLVAEPMFKVPTLTGEGGRLKRDIALVQRRDFELVPDSLWKALSMWYGGLLPLPRQVIRPPGRSEVELELYPLYLRILRHQTQQSVGNTASWSSVVGGYGAAALSTAGLTSTVNTATRRYLAHTAAFSRLATVQQVTDFLCHRLALRSEEARLWLLREHSSSLLDDDNATLQDLGILDSDQILLEVRNKDLTWPEELGQLVASGGHDVGLSVERRPTICLPPGEMFSAERGHYILFSGATGLHNLGNTCFMNSALQAVSNTRPLTLYFQRDSQLSELNSTNPLGTKGAVAKRYAELCRELWAGSTRSVAPLKLRYCVTKHAPHLGGGGQHDSQELLAWLLDALHEDLNRVARKQYTELKDSGGRPDDLVADEAWQQHLTRDHSIITDLFYGQLKSKVTCQTCGHESVRFDPFNLLSLPLPMESYTLCEVLVVWLNGECPVKYGMRLNSEAKYIELKEQLYGLCGIQPDRLLLAEVAYCQIRTLLADDVRINHGTATELYAYELPDTNEVVENEEADHEIDTELAISESPLARSPENNKNRQESRISKTVPFKKSSISIHSNASTVSVSSDTSQKSPCYLIAVHRKCVRQETYFLSQQKSKPSLFGLPLLIGINQNSTCQGLYEAVWGQVTRLLSPMPQIVFLALNLTCKCCSDDSLGYAFPFTLKAVLQGGQICAICHWTQFCRGCILPCSEELLMEKSKGSQTTMFIAIDWDPTALHLRYQSSREKLWIEHESVATCRKLHTEPIDLDYCLKAFTSEERLEAKYHCSNCQDKQPATKKLQIWRLPPILVMYLRLFDLLLLNHLAFALQIIHLKRFDCVNNKWVKTQKVVNFPFKDFDPTAYLASVPQETILRHVQLRLEKSARDELEKSTDTQPERIAEESESNGNGNSAKSNSDKCNDECSNNKNISNGSACNTEHCKLLNECDNSSASDSGKAVNKSKVSERVGKARTRLESTSLMKTPIIDEQLKDYHQHQLLPGQDPFDLRYQLKLSTSSNNSDDLEKKDKTAPLATVDTTIACTNTLGSSRSGSISSVDKCGINSDGLGENKTGSSEKLLKDSPYSSRRSLNSYKCPYGDVKVPKIDTSTAYILFYERSGLDYKPYLPKVVPNGNGKQVPVEDLDENESELRKQLCSIQ
ncbi:hypothetical protein NQ314_000328 [Rhamnusium bicolor]|uniref:ubiquitinyl hydrolase 1 n=1 Tax=Rhamnusium bicolor TaxID=1586634 RepID=A0AAV8ZVB3_9CUCU|nr:hypothetical protein NQ314_000328 [Rhamnusium bicolor]